MTETEKTKLLGEVAALTRDNDTQRKIHAEAVMNAEFIKGNQWIYQDLSNTISEIPYDKRYFEKHRRYRPREVVNIMFPIWRTYKAYLVKTMPRIQAVPESVEDVYDVLGARVATRLMEYMYEMLIIRKKAEKLRNITLLYGTAIMHPFYNTDTKRNDIRIFPATQFFPIPEGCDDWDELTGGIWQRVVPTERLKMQFPDFDFSADQTEEHLQPIQYYEKKQAKNTIIYDVWKLPGKADKGSMARVASGQFLEYFDAFPYRNEDSDGNKKLPYIPVHDNYMSDGLFGFPMLGLIRSRQKSYNKAKSMLAELLEQKPKLFVDINSKLSLNQILDESETIHEYNSQGNAVPMPKWGGPPVVSPSVIQDATSTPSEVMYTTGFNEVTAASRPPGSIQSGIGVENLQKRDELRLIPTLESLRVGLIQTFEQLYSLTRQYYKPSQIKKILGEMGEVDIITFQDIKLSPMTFRIQEASFSPFSEAVRQQTIVDVLKMGILPVQDPRTRRKILEYISPELAGDFDMLAYEERLQASENARMLATPSERVDINPDDNHEIHLERLNMIIKHPNFYKLPGEVQKNLLYHKARHQQEGMNIMRQAQMMAMGMGGQEMGAGGGTQPQPNFTPTPNPNAPTSTPGQLGGM